MHICRHRTDLVPAFSRLGWRVEHCRAAGIYACGVFETTLSWNVFLHAVSVTHLAPCIGDFEYIAGHVGPASVYM